MGLKLGLGTRIGRVSEKAILNYKFKMCKLLNKLTDTTNTEIGDLSYVEMDMHLDAINTEII